MSEDSADVTKAHRGVIGCTDEIYVSLERFGPVDLSFAKKIVRENMSIYYKKYNLPLSSKDFLEYLSEYESYVLKVESKRIGLLCLSFEADIAYIRDIQLLPEYQNRGIGSWAIKSIEALLLGRNFTALRLRVFTCNPAQELYKRLGFDCILKESQTLGMEKQLS